MKHNYGKDPLYKYIVMSIIIHLIVLCLVLIISSMNIINGRENNQEDFGYIQYVDLEEMSGITEQVKTSAVRKGVEPKNTNTLVTQPETQPQPNNKSTNNETNVNNQQSAQTNIKDVTVEKSSNQEQQVSRTENEILTVDQSDIEIKVEKKPVKPIDLSKEELYVVKGGDALSIIARRYDISVKELKERNRLIEDIIYVGQELIVPKREKEKIKKEPTNKVEETVDNEKIIEEERVVEEKEKVNKEDAVILEKEKEKEENNEEDESIGKNVTNSESESTEGVENGEDEETLSVSDLEVEAETEPEPIPTAEGLIGISNNFPYPKNLSNENKTGVVKLLLSVNADGSIRDIEILEATDIEMMKTYAIAIIENGFDIKSYTENYATEVTVNYVIEDLDTPVVEIELGKVVFE
ncbi:MAG: LysM peptidoglycan-binding domain-containing protein [Candidatus Woesearchaeota archaeon]